MADALSANFSNLLIYKVVKNLLRIPVSHFGEPPERYRNATQLPAQAFPPWRDYYRAIVPVHLRQSFGCTEIKRSLHTKDPALARLYAHYVHRST